MDYSDGLQLMTDEMTDELAIVAEFRQGKVDAFDRLYHRYAGFVYNTCLGVLGQPDEARDAMQEAFIQVYRSLPGFQARSSLATWIYRIAVNKCLDAARRRRPVESYADLSHVPVDGSIGDNDATEEQVRMTILKLKPEYRVVLVLFYFQTLSYQEIAQTLHCSLNQVRVRLHRAKQAFRLAWGKEGGSNEM